MGFICAMGDFADVFKQKMEEKFWGIIAEAMIRQNFSFIFCLKTSTKSPIAQINPHRAIKRTSEICTTLCNSSQAPSLCVGQTSCFRLIYGLVDRVKLNNSIHSGFDSMELVAMTAKNQVKTTNFGLNYF